MRGNTGACALIGDSLLRLSAQLWLRWVNNPFFDGFSCYLLCSGLFCVCVGHNVQHQCELCGALHRQSWWKKSETWMKYLSIKCCMFDVYTFLSTITIFNCKMHFIESPRTIHCRRHWLGNYYICEKWDRNENGDFITSVVARIWDRNILRLAKGSRG